jgi:predicted SnoaL-like aldol condensation-catalyzing enzyme
MPATDQTRIATDFLTMVCDDRVDEAYAQFVSPDFRHHNPWFAGDADSLRAGMAQDLARFPGKRITIHQALEDGDRVAVLSHVRHVPQERGYAVVHVFRFEGGRIAELWDVGQEIPADAVNANGVF